MDTNDTISRTSAIAAIDKTYGNFLLYEEGFSREDAISILENLPSISEEEPGEWVKCQDDVASDTEGFKCSKCGYFVPWDFTHKSPYFIEEYHYCPSCGKRMRTEGISV